MKVAVVYSLAQKAIRRIVVTDGDPQVAAAIKAGEGYLDAPLDTYSKWNDAALRSFVASKIGAPVSDRCVEVDGLGIVVAVYHADPAIDKPVNHKDNGVELHATADIGDLKVAGNFVSTKPMPITPTADEMKVIEKYRDGTSPQSKIWSLDELSVLTKFNLKV